uniref:peptidylprolyl isomerase n=1 Tax=Strigamia maritima TaxID=126957 RepID=T1JKE5_STRMM
MPTISTEGTPSASPDLFDTEAGPESGVEVEALSEINISQADSLKQVRDRDNIRSDNRTMTSSDFDLEGLSGGVVAPRMNLSNVEHIKPTSSQMERAEVSEKLDQITAAEQLLEEDVFHSLEDASLEDIELKPTNQFDEVAMPTIPTIPTVVGDGDGEARGDWLDVIGSGDIMKRVVLCGAKHTRPHRGQVVTVNLKGYLEDEMEVECLEDFSFTLGDAEVVQGLELAIPLMDKKETATILVKARFAYGELGREPDIPSNANIKYTIELVEVFDEPTVESLSICERMRIGSGKKDRGNFWFTRGDFSQAIVCYRRALEFLDDDNSNVISDGSLQQLLEDRLKVYNNLALAQLKVDAFDAAIISVDNVIRIQPDNVKALFRKGKILAAQGNTDEAIACMRRALKLEPDTKIIHAELARLQSQKTQENASERELYRKMLGEQRHLVRSKRSSKFKVWGSFLGGLAAVVVGIFAYRQYHGGW